MDKLERIELQKEYIKNKTELDALDATRKRRLRLAELATERVIEGTAEREKELNDSLNATRKDLMKLYKGAGTEELELLKLNFRKTDQVAVTSISNAIDFVYKTKAFSLVKKLDAKKLKAYEEILPPGTITVTQKLNMAVHINEEENE